MKHIISIAAALLGTACALHAQTSHLNTNSILLVDPVSGNRLVLNPATLTGHRTFTFPDANGTLALAGSVSFSINGSLTGDGSGGSPLGINLANANSWSVAQTFAGMVNTGTLDQQGAISSSTGNLTLNDITVVTGELHTQDVVMNPLGNFVIEDNTAVIGNLSASVSLTSTGPAFLNGSVDLGDAAADAVTLNGTLTGAGSGHSLGTAATDATVLTVQGSAGGANELTVTGDVSVSGTLTSGSFGVTGNLDLNGNDIIDVDDLQFTQATSDISNTNGSVVVDDDLNVVNNADVDGTLNADGATTLNGAVALGDAAADAITLNGTLTGTGGGHALGSSGTDATVLMIDGADGGVSELDVSGDVSISGTLAATSISMNGTLDMNGTDIIDVNDLRFNQGPSDISNSAGDVNVSDNLSVTGTITAAGYFANGNLDMEANDIIDVDDLQFSQATSDISNTGGDVVVNDNLVVTGTNDLQGAVSNSTGTLAIADDASVTVDNATTNAPTDVVTLVHTTTGTAVNGIGTGLIFRTEDDAGQTEDAARIAGVLTDVGNSSETSSLAFYTRQGAGGLTETMTLSSTGLNMQSSSITNVNNLEFNDINSSISNNSGNIAISDNLDVLGPVDMFGNSIGNVNNLEFSQAGSNIANSGGDVVVNDNLNVTGTSLFAGSLTLDDVAGGNTTTIMEDGIARSANGNFAINTGAAANSGILSTNGLLSVTGTGRATSSLGDGIHVGRDLTGNAGIELVTAGGPPYIDFTRNGGAVDYDARLILSADAELSLMDASLNVDGNLIGSGTARIGGASAVTNSRLTVNGGHWTSQGSAPTAVGDGTSLAAAVTVSANATDVAGRVVATDGGTIGNGVITVTFNSAYATDPIVVVTPGDNNSASGFFVSNVSTTSFDITTTSTVGNSSTTYSFYYHVIENN